MPLFSSQLHKRGGRTAGTAPSLGDGRGGGRLHDEERGYYNLLTAKLKTVEQRVLLTTACPQILLILLPPRCLRSMSIPHCGLYICMAHDILYCQEITSLLHQEASHAMSSKDMNATMLLDPCQLLVIHEHAVDTLPFPPARKVSIEQRLPAINLQWGTYLKITPQSLGTIIRDEDQSIFATLAAPAHKQLRLSDQHLSRPGCTAHQHAKWHRMARCFKLLHLLNIFSMSVSSKQYGIVLFGLMNAKFTSYPSISWYFLIEKE